MADLVLGLGNPILGDDGVGWRVAERVRGMVPADAVEVDCLAAGGLRLAERMIGYDRVVIVDAVATAGGRRGAVEALPLDRLPSPGDGHTASPHDASLRTALDAVRALGAAVPREVTVVGVEVGGELEFSEGLTGPVAAAVESAAEAVVAALRGDAAPSRGAAGTRGGAHGVS